MSHHGYLKPAKRLLVDIYVSPAALAHAIETADAIFRCMDARGYPVAFAPPHQGCHRQELQPEPGAVNRHLSDAWRPARPTIILVGELAIGVSIYEQMEETEVEWRSGKYVSVRQPRVEKWRRRLRGERWTHSRRMPSGRLTLRFYSPYDLATWDREWPESEPGELRTETDKIVRALRPDANKLAQLVQEGEREEEQQQRVAEAEHLAWQREEAERRRAAAIKASREQLLAIVQDWAVAKTIEHFFDDVERGAAALGEATERRMRWIG